MVEPTKKDNEVSNRISPGSSGYSLPPAAKPFTDSVFAVSAVSVFF